MWCRDVLIHVPGLTAAYAEFHRVLRPGGRVLVYQIFATELLESKERAFLAGSMGMDETAADVADCLWHVYLMIGKLTRRAIVLAKD